MTVDHGDRHLAPRRRGEFDGWPDGEQPRSMEPNPVIDADGHVLEPRAAWAHLDESIRPRIETDARGLDHVIVGDDEVFVAKLGQMGTPGTDVSTGATEPFPLERARAGAFDPAARLVDMDSEGIDVAVLYPTIGLGFWGITDPDAAVPIARAYNDWLAEYCAVAPDRYRGAAMVPFQSPDGRGARAAPRPRGARVRRRLRPTEPVSRTLDRRRGLRAVLGRRRGAGDGHRRARGLPTRGAPVGLGPPAEQLPRDARGLAHLRADVRVRAVDRGGRPRAPSGSARRVPRSGRRLGARTGWRASTTRSTRTRATHRACA